MRPTEEVRDGEEKETMTRFNVGLCGLRSAVLGRIPWSFGAAVIATPLHPNVEAGH